MSGGAQPAADARALAVLLDDRLVTFGRIVSLLRRRRLSVSSVAVGRAAAAGLSRLTVVIHADEPTAERAVAYLRHVVGVRDAVAFPLHPTGGRELALIKVRLPATGTGELLGIARQHGCAVVDLTVEALVLEVSGPGPSIGSCLDALRPFGVIDLARTGTIAIDPTAPFTETDTPMPRRG